MSGLGGADVSGNTVIPGLDGLEAELRRESSGLVKVVTRKCGRQLTWQDAIDGFSSRSPCLRILLSRVLKELPFDAFFWECPPVSGATRSTRLFEFVAIDAPGFAGRRVDEQSFGMHLNNLRGQPVSKAFPNLSGDSILIAPAPAAENLQVYNHIGSFFRHAPPKQLDEQWQTLGSALEERLRKVGSQTNVWVSTEGSGVHWLHMRLDSQPKYYHYGAYRNPQHGLCNGSDEGSGFPVKVPPSGLNAFFPGPLNGAPFGAKPQPLELNGFDPRSQIENHRSEMYRSKMQERYRRHMDLSNPEQIKLREGPLSVKPRDDACICTVS